MGLVGLRAVEFLRDSLNALPIGEIDGSDFFEVRGVAIKDGLVDESGLPASRFFVWTHPVAGPDLLIFVGDAQPASGREYTLAGLVTQVALHFGVNRVITAAALASQIDYMAPSRVWGVATEAQGLSDLKDLGVVPLKDGQIGGLNGLLLGVAKAARLTGACLLGEIPYYTTSIESPKASRVVVDVFARILQTTIDTRSLEERARRIEAQIDNYVKTARTSGGKESPTEGGEPSEGEGGGGVAPSSIN